MKNLLMIPALILLTFFLMIPFISSVAASDTPHVKGQVLVKFKAGTTKEEIGRQIKENKTISTSKIEKIDVMVLQVPEGTEEKVVTAFSHNPHVVYAELDYLVKAFFVPSDTYFSRQWGLENIGQVINGVPGVIDADIDAPDAWNTTTGGVPVAILDSGIVSTHSDLVGKIVASKDFTGSASGPLDVYGHGTHVAGIVAAVTDNNSGVAGGCPACTLLNGKVLTDSGIGNNSVIANGIIWAIANGAKVINLSLGSSVKSQIVSQAVKYAWDNDVVIVAAAGNSNNPSPTYPAAFPEVIAVAATDNLDQRAAFSSFGKWVDVAAPGVFIFSTWKDSVSNRNPQPECDSTGCYKFASGTSMSTPMVAATAGLIWATSHGTSNVSVRNRIESTADQIEGTGEYWSAGRINAAKAVAP